MEILKIALNRALLLTLLFCLVEPTSVHAARKNKRKKGDTISEEDAKAPKPVRIKWRNVERAISYQFVLTDTTGETIIDRNVKTPEIVVDLSPGKYFFQVAAITDSGTLGEFSEKSALNVYPKGSMEETKERVKSIEKVSVRLAQVGGESELGEIGLGRANLAGGAFEYMILNNNLDPFQYLLGASFHFRYYKLFIKNLKPEVRLGFAHGEAQHEALVAGMSLFRAYAFLGYSIELKKRKLFLMPLVGAGGNYFHLSSDTLGRVYLRAGVCGGAELSYQPVPYLQLFARGEYMQIYLKGSEDTGIIVPAFGLAYKF